MTNRVKQKNKNKQKTQIAYQLHHLERLAIRSKIFLKNPEGGKKGKNDFNSGDDDEVANDRTSCHNTTTAASVGRDEERRRDGGEEGVGRGRGRGGNRI